jgi:hypothetical protein
MARVHAGQFFAQGVFVYTFAIMLLYAWMTRNVILLTLYQILLAFCLAVFECYGIGSCRGGAGYEPEQFILHVVVMQFMIVCIFVLQSWQLWKCASANAAAIVVVLGVAAAAAVAAEVGKGRAFVAVGVLVAWFVREGQAVWNVHRCHCYHNQDALGTVVVVCGCGGAVWVALQV